MTSTVSDVPEKRGGAGTGVLLLICWLWVGVPLAWGVSRTCQSAVKLFTTQGVPTQVAPVVEKGR
jgi:hypothetical protein